MPIIDVHIHCLGFEHTTQGYHEYLATTVLGPDVEGQMQRYSRPEALVELLDEAGVDYGVVMAEEAPITPGLLTNEYVADLCRGSKRLIPMASINPYLEQRPAAELTRLVREEGFRALKLYPSFQYFYPNEPLVYPIYAAAQELGIPVMLHTGWAFFPGSRLKYAHPLLLDDVAVDFPRLPLILAHGGRPLWFEEAYYLARLHENVYIDVSGLPPNRLLDYFPELERIADKLLFGSDWPGLPTSIGQNIAGIRRLSLRPETLQKLFWENAARLLRLDPPD